MDRDNPFRHCFTRNLSTPPLSDWISSSVLHRTHFRSDTLSSALDLVRILIDPSLSRFQISAVGLGGGTLLGHTLNQNGVFQECVDKYNAN